MPHAARQSTHHAPLMSVNKSESTPTSQPFPFFQVLRYFKAYCHEHPEVKAQHRSVFYFLLEMVEHRRNLNRFQLNREDGMNGSGIGSKNTYLAILKELQSWGFIVYTPGKNGERAAIIEVSPIVPEMGHWAGQCRDAGRDSGYDAEGTTKKTIDLETFTLEREARAQAEKKIETLEIELQRLKAQTPASHTGGGAAELLDDDNSPKWVDRPRDAEMVDRFLAKSTNPKLNRHAGKGHLFIEQYAPGGWVYGKFQTPVRDWRHLIQSFQFREPPQVADAGGNPIQARLAVAEQALAMNSYDDDGKRLN